MKKVLVTGFMSFPGVPENPSQLLVEELAKFEPEEYKLTCQILPVEYDFCAKYVAQLSSDYDLVIHVGVDVKAKRNKLEMRGQNKCGTGKDSSGKVGPETISEKGSDFYSSIPFDRVSENLSFEHDLSEDAGNYLCNFTLFNSLQKFEHKNVLFYHITDISLNPINQQLVWLEELIGQLLKR
ncbi:MAG: hypothetical protein NE334_16125 [Lentisphaeraceae bacterium]|nr:hypothetical protein [Lentisphaeraceae bacterium]